MCLGLSFVKNSKIWISIVPFHLVFVVASKIKLITFYRNLFEWPEHYSNVIMSVMASQIISLTIVYWIVYTDQRKHQSSASLAFVRGIHRWPVNPPHKGPVTRSMFSFDDVVMIQHTNGEWPRIWHVDVFWPPSEQIRFWSRYMIFRTHGRNGLKFDMLMYLDHLVNWLHSGHSQLIFLILVPFLLSETGQMYSFQAFSWQCMGGIGWN